MREIIRSLILDFHESQPFSGVPRHLCVDTVPGKATVLIGVRRCGKSTYLFQLMEKLLSSGVSRDNILYVNFFDDRLAPLRTAGLSSVAEAYFSLYPEKKSTEMVYCFFDEIQSMPRWEPFIDRLMRTEKCQVVLTGSSAQLLSREVATQMRGRALSWELFPFSFAEYLDARGVDRTMPLSTRKRLLVEREFAGFWQAGGFPEVLGLERQTRVRVHQEYFHAVLFRDLIERHDIAHPKALVDLARRLVDNVASLYSINSLSGHLKALGHKVPKSTVAEYVQWLEDAYFLFTVPLFDTSLARRQVNPRKIYAIDHALVTSVSSGIQANTGHLLENLVFTSLRHHHPSLFYYRTRNGGEVDLVVPDRAGKPRLIQVCESLVDGDTEKRETSALWDAMAETGVDDATIVTRGEEREMTGTVGTIRLLPAWKFLLAEGSLAGAASADAATSS